MKRWSMLLASVLMIGIAVSCAESSEAWQAAQGLLRTRRYQEAAAAFDDLGSLPDASYYAMYSGALAAGEAGYYEVAIANLKSLGDFLDSPILLIYYEGLKAEAAEQYEFAAATLTPVSAYRDAAERIAGYEEKIHARDYRLADEMARSGQLTSARNAFMALGKYADSAERARRLTEEISAKAYAQAEVLLQAGNAADAYDLWLSLDGYADSAARAAEIWREALYGKALRRVQEGDIAGAAALFEQLGAYRDSAEKAHLFGVSAFAKETRLLGGQLFAYCYKGLWGFGNWENNLLLEPAWLDISMLQENGLIICRGAAGYGCIDTNGEVIIAAEYRSLQMPYGVDGPMLAEDKDGSYTLISAEGTELCDTRWNEIANSGLDGLLLARTGDCWGMITLDGKVLTEPVYDMIRSYSEDRAAAQRDEKWGYLDRNGQEIIAAVYDKADDFNGGRAGTYTKEAGWMVIDTAGKRAYFAGEDYAEGMRRMEAGDPAGAAEAFDRAGDVLMAGRAYMALAAARLEVGDFAGAAEAYEAAGHYADAPEQAQACWRREGERRLAAGDRSGAAAAYAKAGNSELAGNLRAYVRAEDALLVGNQVSAYDIWIELRDFEDSAARAASIREPALYEKGLRAAASGDYQSAQGFFESLGDYADSARKAYIFSAAKLATETKALGGELFAYSLNGVWGLGNWGENIIRPARWDGIDTLQDNGLMIMRAGDSYGCIDTRGRTVIAPQYLAVESFGTFELARAQRDTGWGYLNASGEEVVPCQYSQLDGFLPNGLARASRGAERQGYVNTEGVEVIPCEYAGVSDCMEGLCTVAVRVDDGLRYGLVQEDGTILSEAQWRQLGQSAGSVAAPSFRFGAMKAQDEDGQWTLLSEEGAELCDERWDAFLTGGTEDRIGVQRGDVWGFIDYEGQMIARPIYTDVRNYKSGLAAVSRAGYWTYLNREGNEVFLPIFDEVRDFADGQGMVFSADTGWHILQEDGQRIYFKDETYEEGMRLLATGQYETAEAIFDAADDRQMVNVVRYQQADKLLKAGQFEEAIAVFEELESFCDAPERLMEAWYRDGESLLAAADFDGAVDAFSEVETYSDAATRILEAYYKKGQSLLATADYDDAADAFEEAGEYSDAATKILEAYYKKGESLLADADYDEAAEAFREAGDYSDAETRILEAHYKKGESLLADDDYDGAVTAFTAAGSYQDAAQQIQKSWYAKGDELLAAEEYDAAKEAYANAGDYADASVKVQKTFYAKAEMLLAAADYEGAVQAFTQAADYKDAAARAKETLYRQASRLLNRGQDAEAYEAYRQLRGFWDVDDILKKTPRLRRAFIDAHFAPGMRLTFGRYEQDGDAENGPEPIEWIVLEKRKDRALVLSVFALDIRPYNDLYTEVTWEYSALRDWLNLDFVPAAFLPEEQAFVLSSYVANDNDQGYSRWWTRGGRGTRDSAFLLSYLQTRRYETRIENLLTCVPTPYALTRGIETDGDRCSWWLRSPGEYQDYAAYIGPDGALGSEYVTKDTFGVRPAFWIDLTHDPI